MKVKTWAVCLIEPNKFEGQIILDLLRNAGVDKVKVFTEADAAMDALQLFNANIVIASFEMAPLDGAAWTRTFRRNDKLANRKAAVFITSGAFSRSMAEECRHAGANALIGKPISGKILLATINKVLSHPRPFVEEDGYVGPCRRAGIVTAGAPKKRRRADAEAAAKSAATLQQAVEALSGAASQFIADPGKRETCEAALRVVQTHAVNADDGPLMRACAAFALQLGASKDLRPEAVKAALQACVSGILELARTPAAEADKREALAEGVRQAVGKAAMQRAA
jgi:CheY-like chemotaxis protein